ncbi:MAG TPA: GNAT family N-acetyltransferase [Moraxellaceae bacterium]|nr:GNAT family N-acetyltransferase [Moraxellaceae bacterium]
MQIPALLAERGYSLRAARDSDLPWLHDLYASTRAEELATLPWPQNMKRSFTDQQFQLQHQHYLSHYPGTDFLVIEYAKAAVGRYYLQQSAASEYLVIDISLLPEEQGKGIGSELIRQTQRDALARGATIRLHVHLMNPRARLLYERLGFDAKDATATHIAMLWRPDGTDSQLKIA